MKPILLALVALIALSSCATTGVIHFEGDLSALGIPAQFSYSSKNPIRSSK